MKFYQICNVIVQGGKDVVAHPPITPMRAAPRDEFSKGNEWKIYDYVTRHFIGKFKAVTMAIDIIYPLSSLSAR